ncbi:ATP-binding response regulator [Hydrogenophaga laconesensis]|uniref:histidine kinase n=1 Tax=Hydrogenophaga laconesensis TaxID=1805971 RepID=A0ABU1VFV7_9BURK|nr:hybrid sensor histidine kinase/response regulator [Hydrogenophaga laconesensis]MDR7096356.1 signal transduction histidine kinase/CheY-like chemotaxis protein [Hydrogenophaga laconesensis]
MSASAPRQEDQPDPEDSAHTVASLWALRACELLCVFMFATALPWQQPALWFSIIAGMGMLRWWHVNRPAFRALPKVRRQRVYRVYMWVLMSFVGSSCWFLYVPGNVPILALLMSYLLGNATLIAVRLTGDVMRTTIALCLAVLPTSLRLIVDGLGGDRLLTLMGIGGILMTVTMVFLSRAQELGVMRQVEQRRRAEAAADTLAALGLAKSRFFAAVSHDLRQPVHAIGLYLAPLASLAERAQDRAALRAIDGIGQSWRALDDLLSQVLDLTRMDSGVVQADLQPTEIAPLVQNLVRQHSAVAEAAGVRLVALVRPGTYALADGLMLVRVVSNLMDNAIKFSPPGGTVLVTLRGASERWRLQVRDTGMGIAVEEQARVFEEFVQMHNEARDRRQGLGLGLAIARRLVLLMNGSLSVRSALGQGTCMTLTLPRAEPPLHTEPELPDGSEAFPGPGALLPVVGPAALPALAMERVMLVEDDSLVAQATRDQLTAWGLQVLHVATAAEAMERAAFGQVAICDVRLPHAASGLDVALALRAMGQRVLLISGETHAALRDAAARHGLTLLIKPVSGAQLLAALQGL